MAKFVKVKEYGPAPMMLINIDRILTIWPDPKRDRCSYVGMNSVDEAVYVAHTPEELIAMIEAAEGAAKPEQTVCEADQDPYRWRMWPEEKPDGTGHYRVAFIGLGEWTEFRFFDAIESKWNGKGQVRCWQVINYPPKEAQ